MVAASERGLGQRFPESAQVVLYVAYALRQRQLRRWIDISVNEKQFCRSLFLEFETKTMSRSVWKRTILPISVTEFLEGFGIRL